MAKEAWDEKYDCITHKHVLEAFLAARQYISDALRDNDRIDEENLAEYNQFMDLATQLGLEPVELEGATFALVRGVEATKDLAVMTRLVGSVEKAFELLAVTDIEAFRDKYAEELMHASEPPTVKYGTGAWDGTTWCVIQLAVVRRGRD